MSRPGRLNATLRGMWRQLTSMRTALVLLFLLAVAAIPGSLLPQRNVSIEGVNEWYADYPQLAPVVDRLGGFDVYASPWFSAIYLLLFLSLLGCLIPRLRDHLHSLWAAPPDAPRRLSRMPQYAGDRAVDGAPAEAAVALHARLRSRRWRSVVRSHDDGTVTVSAEKGYLKETGNLLMHFAMVAVLLGVGLGGWYGWHGNRLVVAGPETSFCNVLQQYDEYGLGQRVGAGDLPDFCFTLTDFEADFTERGQPTRFLAHAEVSEGGGTPRPVEFTVNSPLRLDGANVYLLGHGYAPVLRYTDRFERSQTITVPFLPVEPLGTAEGLAAFPDANVDPDGERDPSLQMAFQGIFLPTAPTDVDTLNEMLAAGIEPSSRHPHQRDPVVALVPYRGDLGIDAGTPQSVWMLNQDQIDAGELRQVDEPRFLSLGDSVTLDDGTSLEFLGTERWITLSVRHDPGEPVVLAGAVFLMIGLVGSLSGRRRRIWFRLAGDEGGGRVEAGGLPRSDYPGFADEFTGLVDDLVPGDAARPELVTRST
jgi:cytochrome c biogenesis protein